MIYSRKQQEYIRRANKRWNIQVGAVRSGKSYVDIAHVIPERLRSVKDEDGLNLIIGVSKETIERNVLQPMREIYTSTIVGTINSRNIAKVCGVPVYCLGAEKASQVAKIQGASVKYCYGDEIAKWNREVFIMLASRLDKEYSKFDGACNPEYPSHWLKQFIDREDIDKYVQRYTIFDNPFLPKNTIRNLCREYYGTVYYDRYILGKWALAEGLVYPMHEEALVDSLPPGEPTDWALSIDYGTLNAFGAILWALYDGVWYAHSEYYYSGRDTGKQKTDQEYVDYMIDFVHPATEWGMKAQIEGKIYGEFQIPTFIDPSAASFITLMQRRDPFAVRHANNDVLDGLRCTARAMRNGIIKINRKCTHLIDELQGYVWDDQSEEDRPVKVADHLCDSMRYFVKTMGIADEQDPYTPLWNR